MTELNGNNLVVHANALGRIIDKRMTVIQQRFFVIYLSKINPKNKSTKRVIFTLDEYAKLMGLVRYNITKLNQCASDLLDTKVCIDLTSGGFSMMTIFSEFTLDKIDNVWAVSIDCNDKLLPLLFDLKKEFCRYELWNILVLTERNYQQMYRILKQYETIKIVTMALDELKKCLGLEDKYSEYNPFRVRVLDTCKKALSENTDICFEYEPIRKGRAVHSIKFTIHKNTPPGNKSLLSEFVADMATQSTIAQDQQDDQGALCDGFQLSAGGQAGTYSDQDVIFFAEACNNEFTESEMNRLIDVLRRKVTKKSNAYDTIEFERFHVLQTAYLEMYARPKVYNRVGYLLKMLETKEPVTT